jgi:hypothetical protein
MLWRANAAPQLSNFFVYVLCHGHVVVVGESDASYCDQGLAMDRETTGILSCCLSRKQTNNLYVQNQNALQGNSVQKVIQ